jgi:hypothetical protein
MRRNKRLAARQQLNSLSPQTLSYSPIDFQSSSYISSINPLCHFFLPPMEPGKQWALPWILFFLAYCIGSPPVRCQPNTRAHLYYKSSEYSVYLVFKKKKENPKKTPEKGIDDVRWRWWWRPCQKNALPKLKNLNHEWHTRLGCFIFLMQRPLKKYI